MEEASYFREGQAWPERQPSLGQRAACVTEGLLGLITLYALQLFHLFVIYYIVILVNNVLGHLQRPISFNSKYIYY